MGIRLFLATFAAYSLAACLPSYGWAGRIACGKVFTHLEWTPTPSSLSDQTSRGLFGRAYSGIPSKARSAWRPVQDFEKAMIARSLKIKAEVGAWAAIGHDGQVIAAHFNWGDGSLNSLRGETLELSLMGFVKDLREKNRLDPRVIQSIAFIHTHPRIVERGILHLSSEFSSADRLVAKQIRRAFDRYSTDPEWNALAQINTEYYILYESAFSGLIKKKGFVLSPFE